MRTLLVSLAVLLVSSSASAQGINEHLRPLAPFVEKTWRGEFANSNSENPSVDVSRWEWALNGQAIRILHSINDGEYGGETIIMWSPEDESLVGYYFTTAGFMTKSTIRLEDDRFMSHEYVSGHEGGITEVSAVAEIMPDGRLVSSSRYLRNGEWEDGHSVTYREAPEAQVRFHEVSP